MVNESSDDHGRSHGAQPEAMDRDLLLACVKYAVLTEQYDRRLEHRLLNGVAVVASQAREFSEDFARRLLRDLRLETSISTREWKFAMRLSHEDAVKILDGLGESTRDAKPESDEQAVDAVRQRLFGPPFTDEKGRRVHGKNRNDRETLSELESMLGATGGDLVDAVRLLVDDAAELASGWLTAVLSRATKDGA